MPIAVTFNGNGYTLPAQGDAYAWGTGTTSFLAAVAGNALAKSGGAFSLTSEVDFGAAFGLKVAYLKGTGTTAAAGILRLANGSNLSWRNATNTGDLPLTVNGSNQLTFNGTPVGIGSGSVTSVSVAAGSSKLSSTGSPITTTGTITLDVVEGNLTLDNLGGTLSVSKGGTGASTLTGLLRGNGTSAITGSATVSLTSEVTGTLPVTSGGLGVATITGYLKGAGTSPVTASSTIPVADLTGTLTVSSGGTGATSLTGYLTGNGTSAFTASATIPVSDLTGTLGVPAGGTGASTLTGYLVGNGTSAVTAVASIPTSALSGTVSLTSQVSGTLPVTSGGTGLTSATTGDIRYASATNTLANLAVGSAGDVLTVSGGLPTWSSTRTTTTDFTLRDTGTPAATIVLSTTGATGGPASISVSGQGSTIAAGVGFVVTSTSNTAAASPAATQRRARGTLATPAAVNSGDQLGLFNFQSHDGTSFSVAGQLGCTATENWTGGAHGSRLFLSAVPIGSITASTVARIYHTGTYGVFEFPTTGGSEFRVNTGSLRFTDSTGATLNATINNGTTSVAATDLVRKSELPSTTIGVTSSVSSGSTVTMAAGERFRRISTVTNPIASLTVRLPSSPVNGQEATVLFQLASGVTSLTITDSGGGGVNFAPTTASEGQAFTWVYDSSISLWYLCASPN